MMKLNSIWVQWSLGKKIIIKLIGGMVVLSFLYAIFLSDKVIDKIDLSRENLFLTHQYQLARSQLMRMEKEARNTPKLKVIYQDKIKAYEVIDQETLIHKITNQAKRRELKKFMIENQEETKMPYQEQGFFLSAQGTYASLIDFLYDIIQMDRLLTLSRVALVRQSKDFFELTVQLEQFIIKIHNFHAGLPRGQSFGVSKGGESAALPFGA
jgi:Tfp pilus assembly protein PilO